MTTLCRVFEVGLRYPQTKTTWNILRKIISPMDRMGVQVGKIRQNKLRIDDRPKIPEISENPSPNVERNGDEYIAGKLCLPPNKTTPTTNIVRSHRFIRTEEVSRKEATWILFFLCSTPNTVNTPLKSEQ